jgi:glutathionylspermidine synthase
MQRETLQPRDGWQKRLEEAGCEYHTIDGKPYWRETAAYVLSAAEVDKIDDAANELHAMCIEHCADVVRRGDYEGYGFPEKVAMLVEQSWITEQPSLLGRFDFGYDGTNLKMFEYNADTPTSLPETSIWQYHALQDRGWPDQFNSIHEELAKQWPIVAGGFDHLHFAAQGDGNHEDAGNLHYLMESALEALGGNATSIDIEKIGWNGANFTDLSERKIEWLGKLYPWEWLMADEFGWKVGDTDTRFVEPAWKMLLSTKALLPLLWKKDQKHPLLLEAHFEKESWGQLSGEWVRKPLLGREGANTAVVSTGKPMPLRINPLYDKHGYVVQKFFKSTKFGAGVDGPVTPVLGAWIVGDKACGLGIREDAGIITTNGSCFVPHYFR